MMPGKKNPLPHWGIKPMSVLHLAFSSALCFLTNPAPPLFHQTPHLSLRNIFSSSHDHIINLLAGVLQLGPKLCLLCHITPISPTPHKPALISPNTTPPPLSNISTNSHDHFISLLVGVLRPGPMLCLLTHTILPLYQTPHLFPQQHLQLT